MTTDATTARRISRRWPLISSLTTVALVVGLGALILLRGNTPLEPDTEWMEEILEHRSPLWEVPSLVMNFIGAGWFAYLLPIAGIVALLILRRPWSALFVGTAHAISAILVQVIKLAYMRPRPTDQLVQIDSGSFPSGHSANAATMAMVLAILFPRVWVWAAGLIYTVAMMLSRTYLGVHWVSDTIGGLLLGIAVAVVVWAPLAARLQGESGRRTTSVES